MAYSSSGAWRSSASSLVCVLLMLLLVLSATVSCGEPDHGDQYRVQLVGITGRRMLVAGSSNNAATRRRRRRCRSPSRRGLAPAARTLSTINPGIFARSCVQLLIN
uniref:Uncharacterized protein n=1 Tax=Oryza brachyantha TaxID=4533 RepID=J3MBE3_ORYBR